MSLSAESLSRAPNCTPTPVRSEPGPRRGGMHCLYCPSWRQDPLRSRADERAAKVAAKQAPVQSRRRSSTRSWKKSFPASDPPSNTPTSAGGPERSEAKHPKPDKGAASRLTLCVVGVRAASALCRWPDNEGVAVGVMGLVVFPSRSTLLTMADAWAAPHLGDKRFDCHGRACGPTPRPRHRTGCAPSRRR